MKVLIVNQNALVSQAMRAILESHDFEVSLSAYALQARAEQPGIPAPGRPDVALVDIRVPDSGGIEAGRRIIRDHPMAKVLALTAQEDAGVLTAASQAGFHGWVLKDASVSQLVRSIRGVLEGRIQPLRGTQRPGKVQSPAERDAALLAQHLTRREREVLGLLVEGESSQSISSSLSLSPHTVRTHIQNILTKLQVHSRFEAVSFAVRFNMTLEPSRLSVGSGGGEGAA